MRRKRTSSATGGLTAEDLWAHHHGEYRDPHQIASQWRHAGEVDAALLQYTVRGRWWQCLEQSGLTLLVTREYEHLVMALSVRRGRPHLSYLHLPHPNGMAVEAEQGHVFLASTRNPNMIFEFAPCTGAVEGEQLERGQEGVLLPRQARYLPGCLYLHDLALINGELYANAVGLNAVVRLSAEGPPELVWWPRCIDSVHGPKIDKNYLQLNSIAAAPSLAESYFTASTATPGRRRPGHLNFAVDRRGVVFSGATREVVGTGLTRPHSARLHDGEVWVDNSGYGQVGRMSAGKFEPIFQLGGWTRGLFFHAELAFAGTSRVLPRYRHYAPGLDADHCETGVHVLDLATGRVLGSLLWPLGNQIFAIEGLSRDRSLGFPFVQGASTSQKSSIRMFSRGVAA
jgi:uncharacterized protein (TIGR03032 family)